MYNPSFTCIHTPFSSVNPYPKRCFHIEKTSPKNAPKKNQRKTNFMDKTTSPKNAPIRTSKKTKHKNLCVSFMPHHPPTNIPPFKTHASLISVFGPSLVKFNTQKRAAQQFQLKIDPWKRRFLLETTIFRCYVSFRDGSYPLNMLKLFCLVVSNQPPWKIWTSKWKTNRSRMKDPQCQVEIPPRELTYPPLGRGKSSSNMPYQGDENSLEGTSGYIFKRSIFHCHLRFTRG